MEDKYILVECFLNDEHYEYVCDNNEFMTYRVKNIVDVDVFVFYHVFYKTNQYTLNPCLFLFFYFILQTSDNVSLAN